MARTTVESNSLDWDDFRQHLIAEIAAAPDRPYWDSFLAAMERFAAELVP